jgi:hypothetical protein
MAQERIYQAAWETKLAERLDKPQNWKDVMDVMYTDTQVTNLPYIGTAGEPAVATIFSSAATRMTLSNVVTLVALTQSSETLSIVTTEYDAVYLDYADQAQSQYSKWVNMGDLLGKKIEERTEALVLADALNDTNLGDDGSGNVALAATQLTVTSSNIDDICRGVIEQIQTANGFDLYKSNGGFVIWRPADWTKLVTFMQANGFTFADEALRDGGNGRLGKEALGLFHYVSTSHTANHLFAGVRKVKKLGLLKSTFGKTYVTETPSSSTAGFLSGTAIHTRLDYGFKTQTNVAPIVFDVNVV